MTQLRSPQLAEIHAAAFRDSRAWTEREFDNLLTSPHCFYVGDSQGFALGRVVAGETELLTLAVLPQAQGIGHGRSLLRQYHETALSRGAESSFLEVAATNTPAIKLYLSDGYSKVACRKNYYTKLDGTLADALILTKARL